MANRTSIALIFLPLLFGIGFSQQVTGQDLDKILERADKLLDEAKSAYENARSQNSVPAFVDAGFKLEEAKFKYLVLQEIGAEEKQKIAADRLRAVNQLGKLIHDGKVAITGTAVNAVALKSAEAPPAAPPKDKSLPPAEPPATEGTIISVSPSLSWVFSPLM